MRQIILGTAAALSLALGLASASGAADLASAVDASGPGQLIQTAASAMLNDLDAHRADYRANPAKVHTLVDQVLLPHFDTEYSARLVLGHHWTAASEDQRQRFIKAFYKSLLDNYEIGRASCRERV